MMNLVSTRDAGATATLSEALRQGLAPDGGLYLPSTWPLLRIDASAQLVQVAERMMTPFA